MGECKANYLWFDWSLIGLSLIGYSSCKSFRELVNYCPVLLIALRVLYYLAYSPVFSFLTSSRPTWTPMQLHSASHFWGDYTERNVTRAMTAMQSTYPMFPTNQVARVASSRHVCACALKATMGISPCVTSLPALNLTSSEADFGLPSYDSSCGFSFALSWIFPCCYNRATLPTPAPCSKFRP